jgi:hypothetical protein
MKTIEAAHAHTNGEVKIEVGGPEPVAEAIHVCVLTFHTGKPPLLPKSYEQAKAWAKGRKKTILGRGHVLFREGAGYAVLAKVRGKVTVLSVWLPE